MDDALERVIIDHVYPHSPADEAGMKRDDEIVGIDGAKASSLTLPFIRSMLCQDGREVDAVIQREGETATHRLHLRSLIE